MSRPNLTLVVRSQQNFAELARAVSAARPDQLTVQIAADDLRLPRGVYAALRASVGTELRFEGVGFEGGRAQHQRRRLSLEMFESGAGEPRQRFERLDLVTGKKEDGG